MRRHLLTFIFVALPHVCRYLTVVSGGTTSRSRATRNSAQSRPGLGLDTRARATRREPRQARATSRSRCDRVVRALPAAAWLLPTHRAGEAARIPRRDVLGEAGSGIRRSTGAPAGRRSRAGGARREPHRPCVHGRRSGRLGRLPDGRAAPRGVREYSHLAASRRRPGASRCVHRGGGSMRAARQQTDARRDHPVPAAPRSRAHRAAARVGGRRARQDWLRRVPAVAQTRRRCRAPSSSVRSWTSPISCRTARRCSAAITRAVRTRTPASSRRR